MQEDGKKMNRTSPKEQKRAAEVVCPSHGCGGRPPGYRYAPVLPHSQCASGHSPLLHFLAPRTSLRKKSPPGSFSSLTQRATLVGKPGGHKHKSRSTVEITKGHQNGVLLLFGCGGGICWPSPVAWSLRVAIIDCAFNSLLYGVSPRQKSPLGSFPSLTHSLRRRFAPAGGRGRQTAPQSK